MYQLRLHNNLPFQDQKISWGWALPMGVNTLKILWGSSPFVVPLPSWLCSSYCRGPTISWTYWGVQIPVTLTPVALPSLRSHPVGWDTPPTLHPLQNIDLVEFGPCIKLLPPLLPFYRQQPWSHSHMILLILFHILSLFDTAVNFQQNLYHILPMFAFFTVGIWGCARKE